jgi:hypothetical protein
MKKKDKKITYESKLLDDTWELRCTCEGTTQDQELINKNM